MKLDEKICRVIADLEYCVGVECYNPNSYDGWNDIDGCEFRYPINFPNEDGNYVKVRGNINTSYGTRDIGKDENTIPYMKYKFGSNELYIGKGMINVLEYLEDRYGIDFNQMENNLKTED